MSKFENECAYVSTAGLDFFVRDILKERIILYYTVLLWLITKKITVSVGIVNGIVEKMIQLTTSKGIYSIYPPSIHKIVLSNMTRVFQLNVEIQLIRTYHLNG